MRPTAGSGKPLDAYGIKVAFTPLGITVALMFIGLPFVVRTLQPVIEDLDIELEEAAASLGAGRGQVIVRVILPLSRAGMAHGLCAGVCAWRRRIRIGRLHLRQHADAYRDLAHCSS